ncbi:hypothetical protein FB45DRAFT_908640, partial [Roridomyces roridus]
MQPAIDDEAAPYIVGPWLIATAIDLVIQGVLLAQFVKYFTTFPSDPRVLKVYVAILLCLTCIKSAQAIAGTWYQLLVYSDDLPVVLEQYFGGGWLLGSAPSVVEILALYAQSYFCYRLYIISRNALLVAAVSGIFVAALVINSMAVSTSYILNEGYRHMKEIKYWCSVFLPVMLVGYALMTFSTAYYLLKSKREALPSSAGFFKALLVLTFQSAAPATICALVNLIITLTFPAHPYDFAPALAASTPNLLLPNMYAFSVMWTLNARTQLRTTLSTEVSGGVT